MIRNETLGFGPAGIRNETLERGHRNIMTTMPKKSGGRKAESGKPFFLKESESLITTTQTQVSKCLREGVSKISNQGLGSTYMMKKCEGLAKGWSFLKPWPGCNLRSPVATRRKGRYVGGHYLTGAHALERQKNHSKRLPHQARARHLVGCRASHLKRCHQL